MSTYSTILYTHSNTHRHTTHHTPHTKTHKTKIITKELPCRLSYKKNTYALRNFASEKWTFEKTVMLHEINKRN